MMKSKTITTQVICQLSAALFLILVVLFTILTINFHYISIIFSEAQQQLFQHQAASQLRLYEREYQRSAEFLMNRNLQKAEQIQLLYNFILDHPEAQVTESFQCLVHYEDIYVKSSSWCYGLFGETNSSLTQQTMNLIRLTGLLTPLLPIQDQSLDGSVAGTTPEQFFSLWPGDVLLNYSPQDRIWYQNHKKEVEKSENANIITFSPTYQHFIYNYTIITETVSLIGPNLTWDGVISVQLNFSQIFKNSPLKLSESFALIIDQRGKILLSQVYSGSLMLSDQTQTGLNQIDSDQIVKQANGIKYDDVQLECDFQIENILCLRNKTSEQELLVISSLIKNSNLIMTIVVKPTEQLRQMEVQQIFFNEKFQELIVEAIWYQGILLVIVLTITIAMLQCIQKSLTQLNQFSYSQIYKSKLTMQQQILGVITLTKDTNNTINKLKEAFFNLSTFTRMKVTKKGSQCLQIEQRNYPINYQKEQLSVDLNQFYVSYQTINQDSKYSKSISKQMTIEAIVDEKQQTRWLRIFRLIYQSSFRQNYMNNSYNINKS